MAKKQSVKLTKKDILGLTGLTEADFYATYPTPEHSEKAYKSGGYIRKYGKLKSFT